MIRENVGFVTEEEKRTVEKLYERKLALGELMQTINTPSLSNEHKNEIYEKVLADMGKTAAEFNSWWNNMASKYKWKSSEECQWHIDFKTNEIYF